MAAGLSLSQDDLPRFREAFNRVVAQALKGSLPDQVTVTDGQLPQSDLTLALAEALESGGPWGQAFEAPSFEGVFTISDMRVVGEKHLKFRLITEAGLIDAIAFNAEVETWTRDTPKALRCVYRPCVNEYRGDRRLQLQIEALWPQASG